MMKGYVHVYTGNGKGKTTAALGLALRACGAGLRVFIGQFVKGQHYSELDAIRDFLPNATVAQYGRGCFIRQTPTEDDEALARLGMAELRDVIQRGDYDLVILDEANIAVYYGLFSAEELVTVIREKPEHVELVITGRYAVPEVIAAADVVTEMQEMKHYYQQGVEARKGIEC